MSKGMYFDAVLDGDLNPLFNGTPQECKAWLSETTVGPEVQVCIGKTLALVSVNEYLKYPSQE